MWTFLNASYILSWTSFLCLSFKLQAILSNHQSDQKTLTSSAKKMAFSFVTLKWLVPANSDCTYIQNKYIALFLHILQSFRYFEEEVCQSATFRLTVLTTFFTNPNEWTWHTEMHAQLAWLHLSVGWTFVLVAKLKHFAFWTGMGTHLVMATKKYWIKICKDGGAYAEHYKLLWTAPS